MGIFLLKQCSASILFECIVGLIGIVIFIVCLICTLYGIYLDERNKKAILRKRNGRRSEKADSGEPPVLLTPKERREYMLNHIEDGRLYAISSLRNSDTTIVCAKRYDAEDERLYCYAYLMINGKDMYNLHVGSSLKMFNICDFLGKRKLRIDYDHDPRVFICEEENISPYIVDRDYNDFVHSLQAAGLDWKIEKGEENVFGSYKYRLKETRTK